MCVSNVIYFPTNIIFLVEDSSSILYLVLIVIIFLG